jgi:hypothetical protein
LRSTTANCGGRIGPELAYGIARRAARAVRGFDLRPDGRRLAVLQGAEPGDAILDKLVLFVNFFDELRRMAPNR